MKKLYTTLFAMLVCISIFAQVPQSLSYQAVIRDANKKLL